jgi:hypothetical protein
MKPFEKYVVFLCVVRTALFVAAFDFVSRHHWLPPFVLTLISLPGLAVCWLPLWAAESRQEPRSPPE